MILKGLSFLFLGLGVFLLVQIALPFLSYKLREVGLKNGEIALADPMGQREVLGVSIEQKGNFPAFISSLKRTTIASYKSFDLSIPSIGMEGVNVLVDSNDFEDNLAHLPGSSLPGERGNVFISGHSSLTQFYQPGNFKAIFAKLPEIKKGDLVELSAAGQRYRYMVEGLKVVDPKDIGVINPPDSNGRFLSLMTCVPPGFNTKRLVVLARLI